MDSQSCPQCGHQLSPNHKFCPECGCNLSSMQNYDIVCPDCGKPIEKEEEPCPNCGCPSNLYIKTPKKNIAKESVLSCPDCGETFQADSVPSICPECGCPSSRFKEVYQQNESVQKSDRSKIDITIFIVIVIGIVIGSRYFQDHGTSRQIEDSNSYPNIQQQLDYSDIERQAAICEQAKQRFLNEVDNIRRKARSAQYQGVMAQKLFWDAGRALDELKNENEKLQRLLRKHGFDKEARQNKEAIEQLEATYLEEKRRVMYPKY